MRRTIVLCCGLCATAVGWLTIGAQARESSSRPPACRATQPATYSLVAPSRVPTDFPTGFYLNRRGRGYPDRPYELVDLRVTVAAAAGGRLARRYTVTREPRDRIYHRWPFRFARGDGPARVSVAYTETQRNGSMCRRELVRTVTREIVPDPGIRLNRRTVSSRIVTVRGGTVVRRVTVKVTGRTLRAASRPVRLDVYQGSGIDAQRRVKVQGRRFAKTVVFSSAASAALGPIRVVALYPGDFRETWPCDDIFTTGPDDGCTKDLTRLGG